MYVVASDTFESSTMHLSLIVVSSLLAAGAVSGGLIEDVFSATAAETGTSNEVQRTKKAAAVNSTNTL